MSKKHKESTEELAFVCDGCQGNLTLPQNLDATFMTCAYCGQNTAIPEHIFKDRKKRAGKLRKAAQKAADKKAKAARMADKRKARFRNRLIALVVGLILTGLLVLAIWATRDTRPTDPDYTGLTLLNATMASLKQAGCEYVVIEPGMEEGQTDYNLTMKKGGDCVDLIAATGVQTNALSISMTTPFGQSVPTPQPSYLLRVTHCPDEEGDFPVTVNASQNYFYHFAVVGCPRSVYIAPPPKDPVSTGQTMVAGRMKELSRMGCNHVVQEAGIHQWEMSFSPNFAKTTNSNCLALLAASGDQKNLIKMDMTTPFGSPVATPDPSPFVEFLYCPEMGGVHPTKIVPTTQSYYTFAAIDCPRKKAKKILKKGR